MRSRLYSLVIAICIALLVLVTAGCGGGGTKSDPPVVVNQKLHGVFASPYVGIDPTVGDKVTPEMAERIVYEASRFSESIIVSDWVYQPTTKPEFLLLGAEQVPVAAKRYGLTVTYILGLVGGKDGQAFNETRLSWIKEQIDLGSINRVVVQSCRNRVADPELVGYIARIKSCGVPVGIIGNSMEIIQSSQELLSACDFVCFRAEAYDDETGKTIEQFFQDYIVKNHAAITVRVGSQTKVVIISGWPTAGPWSPNATTKNALKWANMFLAWAISNDIEYYYYGLIDCPWSTPSIGPGNVDDYYGILDNKFQVKKGMASLFE